MKTFAAVVTLFFVASQVQGSPSNVHQARAAQEIHVQADVPSVEGLERAVSTAANQVAIMTEQYSNAICCNKTPCFIGCPVDGVPRVRAPSPTTWSWNLDLLTLPLRSSAANQRTPSI